jgi:16S rRNA (guanine527-N7)-methyltransferase
MLELLDRGARELGIELAPAQIAAFERYRELLTDWGRRMDLTTVLDPEGVQRRHFLESLAVGEALRSLGLLPDGARVIDVGSGAGFPGLPVRIVWPVRLTLLEARKKRAAFLETVVRALGLPDVAVIAERAESLAREPGYREAYDVALSRALAPVRVLAELTLPFVRAGGVSAAPKGERLDEELAEAGRALDLLRAAAETHPLATGGRLLVLRKLGPTPERFPRRPGIPSKRPL